MRRIKQRSPEIRIVLGGSTFSGLSGEALFRFFPEVDFLVHGEGEGPLGNIVEHLVRYRHGEATFPAISGVFQRGAPLSKDGIQFDQRSRLGNLPAPDYDDYFALLEGLPPGKRFFPTLPLEMSRGCSWQKAGKGKKEKKGGCAFCNLNLQWRGYRCKDPEQGAEEVAHFCRRHRVLSVAFTDNILPVRLSDRLFGRLASHGKDYHFFCEIRADTPKAVLARMRQAGVKEVQIGIEALSTPLLKRLHKGTTALKNIEIMKHCEHLGVKSVSNLILYFPGSDAADVKETLRLLAFVAPFRPLRTVSFWLGRGSAVQENPSVFGITGVRNHPNYRFLFPKILAGELPLMIQTYRGDRLQQKRLWRPVKERVRQWKKEYARLHEGPDSTPVLAYSDGGTFLIIRQRRAGAPPMNHRLEGLSRKIYLFCDTARSVTEILLYFKELSEGRLVAFLNGMVKKHLMVNEGHRYLSLAVPERKSRFVPSEVELVKTDR
jgi:ribosomal peptide maturation radical SAM protein 1